MTNIFTVDLEDWYCVPGMSTIVPRAAWHTLEARAHIGARLLLSLLRRHGAHATFYVLGVVAERDPDLVREIAAEGHEIASHGYFHEHLETLGPHDFRDDLRRALDVLQSITGREVRGYRAPYFSITARTMPWAMDTLRAAGITHDSSIFPMRLHPAYGIAGAALGPHRHASGLMELPLSCIAIAGCRVPATGGAYFRHLPYGISASLARRCNREGRPVVFYIHPWELDPDAPRAVRSPLAHVRHYRGIDTMPGKLERVLSDFPFDSVSGWLADRTTLHAETRR